MQTPNLTGLFAYEIIVLRFMEIVSRHQCLIYDGAPSQQLPVLAAIMQRKLEEGHRCLYLNSRPMVAGMRSCLAAGGTDVENEVGKGRLILSSDPAVSADGNFDIEKMLQMLEDALDQALKDGYKGLWISGDMTFEFGPSRNFAKLTEYECRLEQLFRKRPGIFAICQYHRDTLPQEATRQALLTHRTVFINETLSRINPFYVPASSGQAATNAQLDEMITALCRLPDPKSNPAD